MYINSPNNYWWSLTCSNNNSNFCLKHVCRPSVQYQPHKSKCADSPDGGENTSKEVTTIDSVYEPMDLHDHLSSSISEYTKEDCSEKPASPTGESSGDGVSGNMYYTIQ